MPAPRNIRNRNEKFGKNVTKRGNVPKGKVVNEDDEKKISPVLIGVFMFLVVGSSLVQIMKLFQTDSPLGPPGDD